MRLYRIYNNDTGIILLQSLYYYTAVCDVDSSGSGDGDLEPTPEQFMCFLEQAIERQSQIVDVCGTSNLTTVSTNV